MCNIAVAPLVGAWIEIVTQKCINCEKIVAPLVGAWIEIDTFCSSSLRASSLLSWERGLKYTYVTKITNADTVAPLVGAWIEICERRIVLMANVSLLSWERGLKLLCIIGIIGCVGRSSRGSVD